MSIGNRIMVHRSHLPLGDTKRNFIINPVRRIRTCTLTENIKVCGVDITTFYSIMFSLFERKDLAN